MFGRRIVRLYKAIVIDCFDVFEVCVLSFSRFLFASDGSDLSRKVREAVSCNLALFRSKLDVIGTSYDQKSCFE